MFCPVCHGEDELCSRCLGSGFIEGDEMATRNNLGGWGEPAAPQLTRKNFAEILVETGQQRWEYELALKKIIKAAAIKGPASRYYPGLQVAANMARKALKQKGL